MIHSPPALSDPAGTASALMRRLGFLTLMLLLPVMSVLSRRAGVVLLPTGVGFLCIAAVLERRRPPVGHLRTILQSAPALSGLMIVAWCAVSLLWTSYPADAIERMGRLTTTIALVAAGYCTMPERVRAANVYLLPIGATLAAAAALLAALFLAPHMSEADIGGFERGLIVLVIVLWPAAAWLRSRDRDLEALFLAAVAAIAVVLGSRGIPIVALAVGVLVFACGIFAPLLTARGLAALMGGLLLFAPVFPFVAGSLADLPHHGGLIANLETWRGIIVDDPLRLITGHGLETNLRDRISSVLPASAPSTVMFEVWYELGVIGACAAAALSAGVTLAIGAARSQMAPGALATVASAFACGVLGVGSAQLWWFSTLAAVVLIFVAAERSQFRTQRPPVVIQRAEDS